MGCCVARLTGFCVDGFDGCATVLAYRQEVHLDAGFEAALLVNGFFGATDQKMVASRMVVVEAELAAAAAKLVVAVMAEELARRGLG